MKRKLITILAKADVSRIVCDHVIGERHTKIHRVIVGSTIVVIGIFIAEAAPSFWLVHVLTMTMADAVRAIGAIPIVELLQQKYHESTSEQGKDK